MLRFNPAFLRLVVMVVSIIVLQVTAKSSVNMPYKNVSVEAVNGKAVFGDNISLYGEPGKPNLPRYSVTFLLPAQTDLRKISVLIEGSQEQIINGDFDVDAALPATFDGTIKWPDDKYIVNGKDISVYEKNAYYPDSFIGQISTGMMSQYKLVTVTVNPYRYNPVTKKLKMITGGKLTVNDNSQTSDNIMRSSAVNNQRIAKNLQSLVVNYADAAATYGSRNKAMDALTETQAGEVYIIITTNEIISQSTQLQNFINSKQNRGFDVQLIDETTWGGGIGDIAAENLRNWLKANYISRNISYVLLIGNPDPEKGDVPMKMTWPRLHETNWYPQHRDCPTDFYYAELSGNWDINNDGYYGDYRDDFTTSGADKQAEIAVGRFPYYGVMTDLDHIMAKTIAYENERSSTFSWRTNMLLPMVPLDTITPSYQLGEAIRDSILKPLGWKSFRIYEKDYDVSPELSPCTRIACYKTWKNNVFGGVIWATHGSSQGASCVFVSSTVARLNDNYPAFTFQASCLTAQPEDTNNLAYAILKNGGIATIGASRVAWYTKGTTNFTNSTCASGMSYSFANNMYKNDMHVSDALNDTKSNFSYLSNGSWMNVLDFNVYGDPAINIYTSLDNFILTSDIPEQKIWNGESFQAIDLNEHVFNSMFTDNQVCWSFISSTNLNVSIDGNNIATITPKSTTWSGNDSVIFKVTTPDAISKNVTARFVIKGTQSVYLSDLNWTSATSGSTNEIGTTTPGSGTVQKDLCGNSGPLSLKGVVYAKGLGTHTPSEIIYQLDGTFDVFSSLIGVQTNYSCGAVFQVFGDSDLLYTSRELTYNSSEKCEVSIRGYHQLRLVANGDDRWGYANWADAKIIRGATLPPKRTIQVSVVQNEFAAFGTVSPGGTVEIDSGSSITIQMLPQKKYALKTLTVDGEDIFPLPNDFYTFKNVNDNHSIQVTFEKDTGVILFLNARGVSAESYKSYHVIGECIAKLRKPNEVAALSVPGYRFIRWNTESTHCIIEDPTDSITTITVLDCLQEEINVYADYVNVKKGDIDGDGEIASTDFAMLHRYLHGTVTLTDDQKIAADVDGDGVVSSIDYACFKRYLLGIITVFPANS